MTKPTPIPVVPTPPALKTPAFPSAYANPLGKDAKLDTALDDAIKAGPTKSWVSAVAIVALNPDGTRPIALFRPDEVHYSASFVKVAAMYAAFELLATVKKIAVEYGKPKTKAAFFADTAAYLNPLIMTKAASIPALKGLNKANAVPSYSFNYDASPKADGTLDIKLNSDYEKNLLQMIKVSSNFDAARCIHRVGYGYLNGALASADFFDPAGSNGMWLAGDYLDAEVPNVISKWPYFRITSVNDKGVAQAATVSRAARLYTLIADRKLVDPDASDAMLKLLKAAADHPEVFINRTAGMSFKVTNNKLGVGPLKTGGDVCSEGSILVHAGKSRRFVVVWQNFYPDDVGEGFEVISNVVDQAIRDYLK